MQGFKPYTRESSNSTKVASSAGRNNGIVSSELLLHSSEHPKVEYIGSEATEDADSKLKHYIAVVDPEKKTWQFIEVRKMTLRSAVKAHNRSVEDESDIDEGIDVCILPSGPFVSNIAWFTHNHPL